MMVWCQDSGGRWWGALLGCTRFIIQPNVFTGEAHLSASQPYKYLGQFPSSIDAKLAAEQILQGHSPPRGPVRKTVRLKEIGVGL